MEKLAVWLAQKVRNLRYAQRQRACLAALAKYGIEPTPEELLTVERFLYGNNLPLEWKK